MANTGLQIPHRHIGLTRVPHILRMAQGLFRVVLALSVVMLGQHNGLNADADRDALHIVMANTTPPLVLAQAANDECLLVADPHCCLE